MTYDRCFCVSCERRVEMKAQEGSSFKFSCFCFVSAAALQRTAAAAILCLLTATWLATSGICSLEQLRVRVFLTVPWVEGRPTLVSGFCRGVRWGKWGEVL